MSAPMTAATAPAPVPAPRSRPVIFTGASVRAILAGTKTMTRRIMKPQIKLSPHHEPVVPEPRGGGRWVFMVHNDRPTYRWATGDVRCPYGVPGDRLWCKETYMLETCRGTDSAQNYPPPFNDGRPVHWVEDDDDDDGNWWEQPHYRATDPEPELVRPGDDRALGWRPSIYMHRWASRIDLELIGVRVERLQDISEEDATAEGFAAHSGVSWTGYDPSTDAYPTTFGDEPPEWMEHPRKRIDSWPAREQFQRTWDDINGKRAPWADNPWCWCLSFRKVRP